MRSLDGCQFEARAQAWADKQPMFYGRDFEPMQDSLGLVLSRVAGKYAYALCTGQQIEPITGLDKTGSWATVQYSYDGYLSDLRAIYADTDRRSDVAFASKLLGVYDEHAEEIETQLTTGNPPLLGEGRAGKVYPVNIQERTYAVKQGGVRYGDIRALRIGAQFDHLSHVVGISYKDQRQVMELIPGKTIDKLTIPERYAIPGEHIVAGIQLVMGITDAGIRLDRNPKNAMYDPETGFYFIDYSHSRYQTSDARAHQLLDLYHALRPQFDDRNTPSYGSPGYTKWYINAVAQECRVQSMFLDALEEVPEALDEIVRLQAKANTHENPRDRTSIFYSDPDERYIRSAPPSVRTELAALKTRLTELNLIGEVDLAHSNGQ